MFSKLMVINYDDAPPSVQSFSSPEAFLTWKLYPNYLDSTFKLFILLSQISSGWDSKIVPLVIKGISVILLLAVLVWKSKPTILQFSVSKSYGNIRTSIAQLGNSGARIHASIWFLNRIKIFAPKLTSFSYLLSQVMDFSRLQLPSLNWLESNLTWN